MRRKKTHHEAIVTAIDKCSHALAGLYRRQDIQRQDIRMVLAVMLTMHGFSSYDSGRLNIELTRGDQ